MRKFQHHKNSTLQRIFQVSSRRDTIKYKCNAEIQIVARFRAPFFRAPPRMGRKIPAAWSAAAGWNGKCGDFSPDARGFSNTLCRGGRLCPPSKFVDFPWPFVGADAHIGPPKCFEFVSNFRKNGQFRRADRVVRPYGGKWETDTFSPENRHKTGAFGGSMRRPQASFEAQPRNARLLAPRWASAPTNDHGKTPDFEGGQSRPPLQRVLDRPCGSCEKPPRLPFRAVGVDAHIDPPKTPVLWRFSGESVEL